MKRGLLSVILLLLTVGCGRLSSQNQVDVVRNAHAASLYISQKTILTNSSCSATAIGPHALLTATHCEEPTDILTVGTATVFIAARIRDSLDHSIYLVNGAYFAKYADVKLGDQLEQGEDVFVFGNPGPQRDQFRRGYVSGLDSAGNVLFDLNGFHGDSGSGIFDKNGKVICVVSVITGATQGSTWDTFKFMGGHRFGFTQEELNRARTYGPAQTIVEFMREHSPFDFHSISPFRRP